MDIQAISDAATVAVACAIVYLIVAKSWQILSRVFTINPSFADSIMSEAAQRFRDQLQLLSRRQSTYLGAGLVFVVMYSAASLFQGPQLFVGYPDWQLYILLTALVAAALFALYRLLHTVFTWRQVRFLRDANIAIGHQLQRIANGHGRAYHDVPTSAGVVDHLLLGHNGVYAINVIAKRHLKKGSAQLDGNILSFSTCKKSLSIVEIIAKSNRLKKELSKQTGHDINVRSVIAVPGWHAAEQTCVDNLLVNERTLAMISGWKDQADYLMDEDVASLQKYLTEICKRTTL
ncbi:MAG: hypothetical protein OER97_04780 [Gammaproteobacteria bacterium]|nr:hypothetical protein [Gammaproteobacteria bacterium]